MSRLIDADAIPWFIKGIGEIPVITKEEIDEMPTVDPKAEEYEWCHDCKEYDQGHHCCHRWTKVIRETVEDIRKPKWIPVDSELPEKTGKYLVSMRNGNVYTKCFDTFTNSFGTGVLAWMELPEAYEEEDDAETEKE